MKKSLTASERIINELTQQITASALMPGTRLAEAAVAEQFGTSRTPAREALRALVQAGLVERNDDRQYTVKQIDLRVVYELYRIRVALEDLLVQELADNCPAEVFAGLLGQLGDECCDNHEIVCSFHETLAELCANQELREMLSHLYLRLEPYRILDGKCRAKAVDDDHRHILRALQAGDVEKARDLMRTHIGRSVLAINDLLDRGLTTASFAVPDAAH